MIGFRRGSGKLWPVCMNIGTTISTLCDGTMSEEYFYHNSTVLGNSCRGNSPTGSQVAINGSYATKAQLSCAMQITESSDDSVHKLRFETLRDKKSYAQLNNPIVPQSNKTEARQHLKTDRVAGNEVAKSTHCQTSCEGWILQGHRHA